MPIRQNVKARRAAKELMNLGITLAKDEGLKPEHVRAYWKHVIKMASDLIGLDREEEQNKSEGKIKDKDRDQLAYRRLMTPERLTDQDRMPFGKYKNMMLGQVPEDYLKWLAKQDWIDDYPDLVEYLNCM